MTAPAPVLLPAIDTFVRVPFGSRATQLAHVTAYTRTGRIVVRAWNETRHRWQANTRTMDVHPSIVPAPAPRHLPAPPPIGGAR